MASSPKVKVDAIVKGIMCDFTNERRWSQGVHDWRVLSVGLYFWTLVCNDCPTTVMVKRPTKTPITMPLNALPYDVRKGRR